MRYHTSASFSVASFGAVNDPEAKPDVAGKKGWKCVL
jgi:hypothetical protein